MRLSTLALCLFTAVSAHAEQTDVCPIPKAPMPSTEVATINSELDQYIVKGMQDWNIPGLSIAIVKNGQSVYSKGFGVRELGKPDLVDENTQFGIMSTTKAMTALSLAMLVDEGKVAWNDPVTKHLPWFQLSNPYVTRELTVRDLLTHNSGLTNTDLLWVRGDMTSRQIIERLSKIELSYSLRAGFDYQNVMYQVAGEVVQVASGMSWAQFVKTRIMKPIGMTASQPTLSLMLSQKYSNVSSPHFEIDGKLRVIEESPVDTVPAAGAAWSTAHDMNYWLKFLLNDGCVGNKRLVSDKTFKEFLKPQVIIPVNGSYPTEKITKPNWTTYGLGWFQQDHHGKFVAMHTGSMPGRTAIIGIMPEENVGVYIFGNADHAEFRHALMWRVLDAYSGAPARDWSAEFLPLYAELKEKGDKAQAEHAAKRVLNTKPLSALSSYAGRYDNAIYGDINIKENNGKLEIAMGPLPENAGTLEHWHYDTFRVKYGDGRYGWSYASFRRDSEGAVIGVRFDDDSVEFTRTP
ncbi:MAG TPA: serine hydrolase [Arenimonas sp.]|nr:serine hydrolase [Arenimonas sp.]